MERYERIVLDIEEGTDASISRGENGELIIRTSLAKRHSGKIEGGSQLIDPNIPRIKAGEYAKELSVYTDKYGYMAFIPPDWTVSGIGTENTIWGKNLGLVIYHIPEIKVECIDWSSPSQIKKLMKRYDQMVYVPVSLLKANGTIDGINYNEKFGMRSSFSKQILDADFYKTEDDKFVQQLESIKKYGGFFVMRYDAHKLNGELISRKGRMPLRKILYSTAVELASRFATTEVAKSHLLYNAEYDTILEWFKETGSKTDEELTLDSSSWGNYCDSSLEFKNEPDADTIVKQVNRVVETGSQKKWCANNLYDFGGNVSELTLEGIIRGGNAFTNGNYFNVSTSRNGTYRESNFCTGLRVSIFIA